MIETKRAALVLAWLNSLPCTHAIKKHTGPYGEAGHPDVFACSRGRMVLIEMKQPKKRPEPLQMKRLRDWQEAGALVGWAESVEHAQQIMAHRDDLAWRNTLEGPGG